jgi:DnaJ-domain-containing protein 1
VSIGRRLIDLARAELNSLLEKAAGTDDGEEDPTQRHDSWSGGLDELSDAELEAELERRRQARQEAEQAARAPRPGPIPAGSSSNSYARRSSARPDMPRRTAAGDDAIRKAYAALEVPPGSDFETVRKSYRRMMRRYHPDLHVGSPEKQRAANELTQRLTEAYKLLEKHLRVR